MYFYNTNKLQEFKFQSLPLTRLGGQRTLRSATQLAPFISALFFGGGASVRIGWIYTFDRPIWLVRFFVMFWSLVLLLFTPAYVGFEGKSPIASPEPPLPPSPETKERKKGKGKRLKKKNQFGALLSQVYLIFILTASLNCTFLAALRKGGGAFRA